MVFSWYEKEMRDFMKKKLSTIVLMFMMFLLLSACGKKDGDELIKTSEPFEYVDVQIGDSKDEVLEKCGDDAEEITDALVGYNNLKLIYNANSQWISFPLNDSGNVYGIASTWRTESEEGAQNIYNNLKSKCESKYGDSYDATHDDEVTERCVWETSEYRVMLILQLNDKLNGNMASIQYWDYNEMTN